MNIEGGYVDEEIRILWQLCVIFNSEYAKIKCEIDFIYIECEHSVISLPWYMYDINPGKNLKKDWNNQELSVYIYLGKFLFEV
jgi:hypothetical protein